MNPKFFHYFYELILFWSGLDNGVPVFRTLEAAAAAKSLQSCLTLSNPMDCSLPGSPAHGIFQARELEWGAIAFSLGDSK